METGEAFLSPAREIYPFFEFVMVLVALGAPLTLVISS